MERQKRTKIELHHAEEKRDLRLSAVLRGVAGLLSRPESSVELMGEESKVAFCLTLAMGP